jgi:NDP-sugar pyrophosphorylase family protein
VSIGAGAKVGQGARLNRVAVLDGAEVPAGVQLQDQLVGPGMSVSTT